MFIFTRNILIEAHKGDDNLMPEDIENGYTCYIDYEMVPNVSFEQAWEIVNKVSEGEMSMDEAEGADGGMWLTRLDLDSMSDKDIANTFLKAMLIEDTEHPSDVRIFDDDGNEAVEKPHRPTPGEKVRVNRGYVDEDTWIVESYDGFILNLRNADPASNTPTSSIIGFFEHDWWRLTPVEEVSA